jgi:hypothetical protein
VYNLPVEKSSLFLNTPEKKGKIFIRLCASEKQKKNSKL